jgi:hypothetical protein
MAGSVPKKRHGRPKPETSMLPSGMLGDFLRVPEMSGQKEAWKLGEMLDSQPRRAKQESLFAAS